MSRPKPREKSIKISALNVQYKADLKQEKAKGKKKPKARKSRRDTKRKQLHEVKKEKNRKATEKMFSAGCVDGGTSVTRKNEKNKNVISRVQKKLYRKRSIRCTKKTVTLKK